MKLFLPLVLASLVGCAPAASGGAAAARVASSGGVEATPRLVLDSSEVPLRVHQDALYPETLAYNERASTWLLGSFRDGAIYEVDENGQAQRFVDDPRLCSVLGIAVDSKRGRLWAVTSDLGVSRRPSASGTKKLAAVAVYDLTSGAALQYIDLASLAPGPHLVNGIALDAEGSAYVTDSFSPTIYKVEADGRASVFLQSAEFAGEGVNLNGVVVHPDGYLLVIKKSDGALFKVPLAAPEHFTKVQSATRFVGGDGLSLIGPRSLLLIANQTPTYAANAAFAISSDDGWQSAVATAVRKLGDVYPTTASLRDGKVYVVHSKLNELIMSASRQDELHIEATIEQIGRLM
ncbi:MAG: hypothetical protein JWN48_4282 [Myxococcaceae bacterium]|nr:hypothetical protein [Myxococcaceae bacterium]